MNCQRIERNDVQMLGWGRRGVLQEMNIVVQSGLISQKKESNSFMCPSSYPGHLCWAQKACGDFTSYGILEGGEGRKKSALYSYGSGRTRSKGSHLINSQVVSSGLRQTVESLRKHLLCAGETHFSHQRLQECLRFTDEESRTCSDPLAGPRSGSRRHMAKIPVRPSIQHPFPPGA